MVLVGSAGLDCTFASLPSNHDWKQELLQGSEVNHCSGTVNLKAVAETVPPPSATKAGSKFH